MRKLDEETLTSPVHVQIHEVVRSAPPIFHQGLEFHIDQPLMGTEYDGCAFTVSGWVFHPRRVAKSIEVFFVKEVAFSRDVIREWIGWGEVNLERRDVEAAYSGSPNAELCGFRFTVGTVGLPAYFTCAVMAHFADGSKAMLAQISGWRPPLATPYRPKLQPLHMTIIGRTGSTHLLALLAAHPAIVIPAVDERVSAYWLQVLKVLSRPANHDRSANAVNFADNAHSVGNNPFNLRSPADPDSLRRWYDGDAIIDVAAFCQRNIDRHYSILASHQGREDARYFVEKRSRRTVGADLIEQLYPQGKEVFVIRDYRDMLASIFAFNAKRHREDFGRATVLTDEDYVERLAYWAHHQLQDWKQRQHRSLLVKYEELVADGSATLHRILDYLDLDHDQALVDSMIATIAKADVFREHRTTATTDESIGRWQRDLTPALQAKANEQFGATLIDFGYRV